MCSKCGFPQANAVREKRWDLGIKVPNTLNRNLSIYTHKQEPLENFVYAFWSVEKLQIPMERTQGSDIFAHMKKYDNSRNATEIPRNLMIPACVNKIMFLEKPF